MIPLQIATAVARALMDARGELALTWEAPMLEAWRAVASARSMEVDERRFAMRGRPLGQDVSVRLTSLSRHIVTELRVALERANDVRLRIFEASGASRFKAFFHLTQDIAVGEPRFDERFMVQGKPEEAVRALLGGGFADHVLSLAETNGLRSIAVEDGVLEAIVEDSIDDAATLGRFVDEAAEAARALARAGGAASPYRG
jgi:hypothetical protein